MELDFRCTLLTRNLGGSHYETILASSSDLEAVGISLLGPTISEALAATDYTISISGGVLTVTNNTNHADNLKFNEPSAGNISFTATGRTFDNNGGGDTIDNSAATALSGLTSIVINGGSGGETFSTHDYSDVSAFPSLTINGGAGNDTVNFTGKITFGSNNNLSVNLQNGSGSHGVDAINVSGAQLLASGGGTIDLECSQSVAITGGAVVQTAGGNLTVMANQQATATAGNFNGVNLDGAGTKVQSTGSGFGTVTVKGVGGTDGGGFQLGVNVANGAQIIGSVNIPVKVTGVGGASAGVANRGVTVYGQGSAITSPFLVTVTGTGGASGTAFGIGVSVLYGGVISATNAHAFGTIVTGTGAGAAGSTSNDGVEIAEVGSSSASLITSANNAVSISGTAGGASGSGLHVYNSGAVTNTGSGQQLNISADSLSIDSTAIISTAGAAGFVSFAPAGNATQINLGGASTAGVLGLSQAILDRVSTNLLAFDIGGNDLTISSPITRSSATNVFLGSNGATGHIRAKASGTDLSVGVGTVTLYGMLAMPITGAAADASPGYPQFNVAGNVNLNGAPLDLSGTTYAGAVNDQFTIVKNSGSGTTTTGTFQNLPEGATFAWPANSSLITTITYKGGSSGQDVVLTLSAPGPTPSPTPSPTPTSTPTATPTSTPTATPTATPTSTPTSTPAPTATPSSTPGLVGNVSTRLPVGTGDNVLIEGFIVQGPAGSTKKIIVRAIGPSLAPFGITDALANPTLEIHDASGATIATNDNWKTTQVGGIIAADQATEIAASQLAPSNDLESAIIANLAPGSYTGIVGGANNTIGTGVVDAYDLSPSSAAKLANIATRGLIQPGDKLMIAGFIVQNAPVPTVVRAIGPSLVPFGIPNALPDTTLQLRDQNGTIVVQNDDWKVRTDGSSQQAELEATGLQPTNDLEAAFLITLQPGQYTAQVRGKPEQTGIGVVQVYFLQ
ncbi:MAG: mucin9 [Verrucomicrobiota bacterium]